jgi:hypothetical protein
MTPTVDGGFKDHPSIVVLGNFSEHAYLTH